MDAAPAQKYYEQNHLGVEVPPEVLMLTVGLSLPR
jgi:hypothetical protein